jgi:hypothetical protein
MRRMWKMNDKLNKIVSRCKCGVYVSINPHRDQYLSVTDWLDDVIFSCNEDARDEITEETVHGMIVENTIIQIRFYPDTPIGFYRVFHYDLDTALDVALKILEG